MSKISINLIEQKLKEILKDQDDVDITKFDDATALNVIFATYYDQSSFNDIILERYLNEIQELKLAELQLRIELKFLKDRERQHRSQNYNDGQSVKNSTFEESQYAEKQIKQLQNICQAQEQYIK
jgi:hypothetical protein